jgi:hypothetical protein
LEVIEELDSKGAGFRSLGDPVDTTTAQGKFTLQILGAVAELERALIRERTIAGLETARRAGRVGGNPKLKARDPEALKAVADTINRQHPAPSKPWAPDRVKRAARRFVKDGMLDAAVMSRAPKAQPSDRLAAIVAAMVKANPKITLREIARALEQMRERSPSGAAQWFVSSVKMLKDRAIRMGLVSETK